MSGWGVGRRVLEVEMNQGFAVKLSRLVTEASFENSVLRWHMNVRSFRVSKSVILRGTSLMLSEKHCINFLENDADLRRRAMV